jgi:HAD superfamily hydrolase (TIGR01484 family)
MSRGARAGSTPLPSAVMTDHRSASRPAPAFPIRMIAIDIDGTLVGGDLRLSARTAAAIRAAAAAGVRVSLASGRMASSGAVYAHQLGLTDPIIGHQGASVRMMAARRVRIDPHHPPFRAPVGRLLHHTPLAAAVAREAIGWCLDHGLDPHVNALERIVVWRGDVRFDDYSGYLGPAARIVPDLVKAIRRPVSKVLAVGEPPRPMELIEQARRHFAGRADVTVSHPRFLEFVAPGVSKGRAVAWLAHHAGVPPGQVLTIGDSLNDLEMIVAVGHGAAVETAPEMVRAAARYVAPAADADGVAVLINALVLPPPEVAARNAVELARNVAEHTYSAAAAAGSGR